MAVEVTQDLVATECCVCGVLFLLPSLLLKTVRKKGGYVHCPNGHSIGWDKGELEKELDRTKRDLAGYKKRNESLSSEVQSLEASNRGLRAANTRLKNKNREVA